MSRHAPRLLQVGLLAACLLSGFACASEEDHAESADARGDQFVFVFLTTGSGGEGMSEDDIAAAQAGHFANMARLADENYLLLAGPLGPPRSDEGHRGILLFDVATLEKAEELTVTDPAVQAGLLGMEAHLWRSTDPIRAISEATKTHHAELEAAAAERGETLPPGAGARPFYFVSTAQADVAEDLLMPIRKRGRVPFSGRFVDSWEERAIFCIDAQNLQEAQALVELAVQESASEAGGVEPVSWTYHGWFSSSALLSLREQM